MIDMARFLNNSSFGRSTKRQPQKQLNQNENMDIENNVGLNMMNKNKKANILGGVGQIGVTTTIATQRSALGDLGNKLIGNGNGFLNQKKEMTENPFAKKTNFSDNFVLLKNQEPVAHTTLKPEFILLQNNVQQSSKHESSQMDISEVQEDEHMKSTIIVDIDEDDHENPQLCAEYAKDIYNYLYELENKLAISSNFMDNKKITSKMRAVLVDWLIQVHSKFHLLQETLYLCVSIIDSFLQVQDVYKEQLQLVGVTAMFIASKYEEMYVPTIEDFVYMTDNTYTKADIRKMEIKIIHALNFLLGKPIALTFLRRFSKAGQADPKQHTMAKFLMELSLHDSEFSAFNPSYLAACALCLACKLLGGTEWNDHMVYYSKYKYSDVLVGVQKLCKLVIKSSEADYKYKAVTTKYSSSKYLRISLIGELQNNMITEIANMHL